MKQHLHSFKNIAGVIFGILAVVIAILVAPILNGVQNDVANLDRDNIRGVWFVPDGKTEDEIIWLDSTHIEPLYDLLDSETIEENPLKWKALGRVGFTCQNGRHAGVEIFDTKTNQGAFRCGDTYFRYKGSLPAIIRNAR